jgi:hypothetical protein
MGKRKHVLATHDDHYDDSLDEHHDDDHKENNDAIENLTMVMQQKP